MATLNNNMSKKEETIEIRNPRGRVGLKRNNFHGKAVYDPSEEQIRIRVDDGENPEFWFQCEIPWNRK